MSDATRNPFPRFLRERYATPASSPVGETCRVLRLPADEAIRAAVNEVLFWLAQPEAWYVDGGISTEDTSDLIDAMLNNYFEEECAAPMSPYMLLKDIQNNNVAGGGFTSGAWRVRAWSEIVDSDNLLTPSGFPPTLFTIPAGLYQIKASAPGYAVNRHQIRLWNVTDGIVQPDTAGQDCYGSSEQAGAADTTMTRSFLTARFQIAASKQFQLEHRCSSTKATDGMGLAGNLGGKEVYTEIELWQIED